MIVKELIQILEKEDQDAELFICEGVNWMPSLAYCPDPSIPDEVIYIQIGD
jgi:hypothetical protein